MPFNKIPKELVFVCLLWWVWEHLISYFEPVTVAKGRKGKERTSKKVKCGVGEGSWW